MEYYDKKPSRRPAHPHAVSSFTRREKRLHPNMYPEGHVHMDDGYHKATSKYRTYHRNLKKAAKKGTTGGRRRRGSRYTRRR